MKTTIKYTTYEGNVTYQTFIGLNADSIDAQISEFEEYMHNAYGVGGYKSEIIRDDTNFYGSNSTY